MPSSLESLLRDLRACRWVDLTHAFAPGIPHYAGFPDEERRVVFDHADGFLAHEYRHVGQWGTHCDPPSHFVPGGRTLDAIGVREMVLPLVVLDVREAVAADPDHAAGPAAVHAHEARHGRIAEGAFAALLTGWGARWPDGARMANADAEGVHHSPGWGVDAVRLLVEERGVTAIGHDVTDTDPGALVSSGRVPAEAYLLGADRWQLELLARLDELPPAGGLIVASWPKPLEGSGFPARAWAIVPEDRATSSPGETA
jgi:kynurenine formamidase